MSNPSFAWMRGILPNLLGENGLTGFVFGILENTSPNTAHYYIKNDIPLVDLNKVKEYRGFADQLRHLRKYTNGKAAIAKLAEERPDLASVFLNHPQGMDYLQRQFSAIIEVMEGKD